MNSSVLTQKVECSEANWEKTKLFIVDLLLHNEVLGIFKEVNLMRKLDGN